MDKKQVFDMLKDEISGKLDADARGKLQNAKSPKDALSILEGASIELDDEILSAVAAGELDEGEIGEDWCFNKQCGDLCPDYCWIF